MRSRARPGIVKACETGRSAEITAAWLRRQRGTPEEHRPESSPQFACKHAIGDLEKGTGNKHLLPTGASMVRKGSPVRVRQRAPHQDPRTVGGFAVVGPIAQLHDACSSDTPGTHGQRRAAQIASSAGTRGASSGFVNHVSVRRRRQLRVMPQLTRRVDHRAARVQQQRTKRMPQRRLPCRSGLKLRRCTTRSRAWRSGITMRPLVPRRPRDASLITLVADATRRGCLVSAGDEPTTDRARPCACGPDGRQRSGGARRTVRRPGCSGPRRRHRRPRVRRTDCACSRCGGCPDA